MTTKTLKDDFQQSIKLYSNLIYYQISTPSARKYRQQWDNFWSDTQVTCPHNFVPKQELVE